MKQPNVGKIQKSGEQRNTETKSGLSRLQPLRGSAEDYLEAIYNLSINNSEQERTISNMGGESRLQPFQGSAEVRSVDVSKVLNVAKPSTHKALNLLSEHGYITKQNYGTITLTELGKKTAQDVLKKHEAIRALLTEILKVSPQVAEEDACKIEHCISSETTQKLYKFLANHTKNS